MISTMSGGGPGRIVYSTDRGRVCPVCGRTESECTCAAGGRDEPLPARVIAKLRIETKGRGGKTVTVIDGLPRNAAFLKELAQELKRACGTGGSVADGAIELQGDRREQLRDLLTRKGFVVKG